jgi:hypothetical protein
MDGVLQSGMIQRAGIEAGLMRFLFPTRVVSVGLLGFALLATSGCTRPNPELLVEALPDLSVSTAGDDLALPDDLATPWVDDLATTTPHDLTRSDFTPTGSDSSVPDLLPPVFDLSHPASDLATPHGVSCGNQTCSGATPACCYDPTATCVPAHQSCNSGPFACDGPEDCAFGQACCFDRNNAFSTCSVPAACPLSPLCHATADCPALSGFVACCPIAGFAYKSCSRIACK